MSGGSVERFWKGWNGPAGDVGDQHLRAARHPGQPVAPLLGELMAGVERQEQVVLAPVGVQLRRPDADDGDVAPEVLRRREDGLRPLPVRQIGAGVRPHAPTGRADQVIGLRRGIRQDARVAHADLVQADNACRRRSRLGLGGRRQSDDRGSPRLPNSISSLRSSWPVLPSQISRLSPRDQPARFRVFGAKGKGAVFVGDWRWGRGCPTGGSPRRAGGGGL